MRRLCLDPAGVINCTLLSSLSFWVSLFPGMRGYNSRCLIAEVFCLFGLVFSYHHPLVQYLAKYKVVEKGMWKVMLVGSPQKSCTERRFLKQHRHNSSALQLQPHNHLEALMAPLLPWRECHLSATVETSRWAEVKCLSLYMILLENRTTGAGSETLQMLISTQLPK